MQFWRGRKAITEAARAASYVRSQWRASSYLTDGPTSQGTQQELEVWAWGRASHGQVGHGKESTEKTPIPVMMPLKVPTFFGIAPCQGKMPPDLEEAAKAEEIRFDILRQVGVGGAVVESMELPDERPKPKPRLGNVGITCGLFHSMLWADQDVWVWGKGEGGRLGLDAEYNQYSPLVNPRIKRIQMATAGGLHTIALTDEGNVYTWGFGAFGALGHGSYAREVLPRYLEGPWEDRVVHVAAGGSHTAAITANGDLYTWGRDEGEGRLGHGNPELMDEGALSKPTKVEALEIPVASVSCGGFFTMALTTKGQLWSWGGNKNYELGRGSQENDWKPKVIPSLENENIIQVACGGFHAAALTDDGKVATWGFGGNGQLGHGNMENGQEPAIVEALADKHVTHIACGPLWTAAITEMGDLYTWGRSRDYQLGLLGLKDEQVEPMKVIFPPHDDRPIRVLSIGCGSNHGVCVVSRTPLSG